MSASTALSNIDRWNNQHFFFVETQASLRHDNCIVYFNDNADQLAPLLQGKVVEADIKGIGFRKLKVVNAQNSEYLLEIAQKIDAVIGQQMMVLVASHYFRYPDKPDMIELTFKSSLVLHALNDPKNCEKASAMMLELNQVYNLFNKVSDTLGKCTIALFNNSLDELPDTIAQPVFVCGTCAQDYRESN